jgi:molecular chaperone DnaK
MTPRVTNPMGRAIGIHLGDTNSVAAIKDSLSGVRVVQNRESQDLTPSVVGMHKKQVVVGQLAIDRALLSPKETIYSVKRLMGRGFRDEQVQKVRSKYLYDIVEPTDGTDDDVRVVLDAKQYSPPEVSSMILKKIKEDAELRLSDKIEFAVITVPAYFTEKQKDATRKAGQLAGLKVQKILDEPTAAAIAFGVDNVGPDDSKTILVYDLGGGTFDVSVLTIVGGIFVQLNIEGNMWLGGDDFDHKIMDHVVQHIESVHNIDPRKDARFMIKLKEKAEQAKKDLSSMNRTDITLPGMLKNEDGDLIDIETELSRAEFERMIAKDVAESVELVKVAIKNAGEMMTPDQIDYVILVGGSSQIPLVRKSLAAVFGEQKLLMNVDPMKCVAYGAAVLAAEWADKVECPKGHVNPGKNTVCEVSDCGEPLIGTGGFEGTAEVTGMHYGIQAKGDKFEIIIPKGAKFPLPEPVKCIFVTPRANLKRLRVPIYAGSAGEDQPASKNELQATVWLELPDNVPANAPLEVAFSLDGDGILERVRGAMLDGSGAQIEAFLDRGNTKRSRLEKKLDRLKRKKDEMFTGFDPGEDRSFEEVYSKATKALSANDPKAAEECAAKMEQILKATGGLDPEWKQKAQGLCGFTEVALNYSFLLEPRKVQQIKTLLDEMQKCVNQDDEKATLAKYSELDRATDDLPGGIYAGANMIRCIGAAQEKGMEVEANHVRVALANIEAALRNGDHLEVVKLHDEIQPVLRKIDKASGVSYKPCSDVDYVEQR